MRYTPSGNMCGSYRTAWDVRVLLEPGEEHNEGRDP
jgi:hypothetical protein